MFTVGIINPSWHYWANPCRIQPMNELYFATVIETRFNKEVSVNVIDLRGIRLDQQPYHVPECDLYLYWIAKTGDYNEVQYLVEQLRLAYPKAKHAAGGTHVDIFPSECARQLDSIVRGPGEESFNSIIKDCQNGLLKQAYQSDYSDVRYGDYPFIRRHFLPKQPLSTICFSRSMERILRAPACCFHAGAYLDASSVFITCQTRFRLEPLNQLKKK